MNKRLILGSSSIFREWVLSQQGLKFEILSPDINEKAIRNSSAEALTSAISNAKAIRCVNILEERNEQACIITADQVMRYVTGEGDIKQEFILEKPETEKELRYRLRTYHTWKVSTVSAVTVWNMYNGKEISLVDVVDIKIDPFTDEEIKKIVADPLSMNVCGGLPSGLPGNIACEIVDTHQHYEEGKYNSVMGLPFELLPKMFQAVDYNYRQNRL